MSLHRRNARRDANEKPILDALRRCGVQCWRINGDGLPDVLTLYKGRYVPLEVKTATGRRTKRQTAIPWPVVRDLEQALFAIGVSSPTSAPQSVR